MPNGDLWTPAFRRSVEIATPGVLVRLAPLLDTELEEAPRKMSELARWCQQDYVRVVALVSASVTTLYSYNCTPGVLRAWAQSMEQANIRAYKPSTIDTRRS